MTLKKEESLLPTTKQNLFLKNKFLFTLPYYLLILAGFVIDRCTIQMVIPFDMLVTLGTALALNIILWKVPLPQYATIVIFLFFAQFGGMMFQFYEHIAWYDLVVHFGSGIMLVYIGQFVYSLIVRDADSGLPVLLPTAFGFFFSAACAGFWEIYEFAADHILGLNSQLGSLSDTMGDIIAGALGALIAAITLYVLLARKKKQN